MDKIIQTDLRLFEDFVRRQAARGIPLIESSELSKEDNAIIRKVNKEAKDQANG